MKKRLGWRRLERRCWAARELSVGHLVIGLDEIPQISIQIFKDSYCPVGGVLWFPNEAYSGLKHLIVVAPEVIGAEEEEDPAACLPANERGLLGCCGAGQ